jgi:hypothetical protein
LQNDRHQKWSTYLQQFHLNIKYNTGRKNCVVDCIIQPPVVALITVLHFYGHEAYKWPQLYQRDLDFSTTYHLLVQAVNVTDFHIQDGFLCHLCDLCVVARERENMIWEAHYSRMAGHFGVEKTVVIVQKHFYWPKLRQDVNKYIKSCIACVISKPTINKKGSYTPLPTPKRPWESISMYYMFGLSSTKKCNDCVFVVVDQIFEDGHSHSL